MAFSSLPSPGSAGSAQAGRKVRAAWGEIVRANFEDHETRIVDLEDAIDSEGDPTGAQNTFLVTGGQIIWQSAYTFDVSAATYYILGTLYSSDADTVTLSAAHATLNRIDVIAVDNTGAVVVIEGTAAAQPAEPSTDPGTQVKLGFITVGAATSEPDTVVDTLLYAEAVGDPTEWDWAATGSGFSINSTNNPRSGTFDIEGTAVANGAFAQGEKGTGTIEPNDYGLIVIYIRSKATWNNNRGLAVTFRLNGAQVGNAVTIQRSGTWGFASSNTSDYQAVAIPITSFAIANGETANQVRITDFGGSIGFYLDDIRLQAGAVDQAPVDGITQTQADARYAQRSNNLSDLASASTARTNIGAASITPSFVTLATTADLTNERVLTGTSNQVTVTDGGAGTTATLSTPQDLHTSAVQQLGRIGLAVAADSSAKLKIAGQYGATTYDAGNSSTALTLDWDNSNTQLVTMTDNCTFTLSNPKDGFRYLIALKQDGSGSHTATWPASVKWRLGVAPTLTTSAGHVDIITLVWFSALGASGNYLAAANTDYTPA